MVTKLDRSFLTAFVLFIVVMTTTVKTNEVTHTLLIKAYGRSEQLYCPNDGLWDRVLNWNNQTFKFSIGRQTRRVSSVLSVYDNEPENEVAFVCRYRNGQLQQYYTVIEQSNYASLKLLQKEVQLSYGQNTIELAVETTYDLRQFETVAMYTPDGETIRSTVLSVGDHKYKLLAQVARPTVGRWLVLAMKKRRGYQNQIWMGSFVLKAAQSHFSVNSGMVNQASPMYDVKLNIVPRVPSYFEPIDVSCQEVNNRPGKFRIYFTKKMFYMGSSINFPSLNTEYAFKYFCAMFDYNGRWLANSTIYNSFLFIQKEDYDSYEISGGLDGKKVLINALSDIEVHCEKAGASNVYFMKGNKRVAQIINPKLFVTTSNDYVALTIRGFDHSVQGKYQCYRDGRIFTAEFVVHIAGTMTIDISEDKKGGRVMFHCLFNKFPINTSMRVQWFFTPTRNENLQPIRPHWSKTEPSPDTSQVETTEIQSNDIGWYYCKDPVTGFMAEHRLEGSGRVAPPPLPTPMWTLYMLQKSFQVSISETATFTCSISNTNSPQPVTWWFGDRQLAHNGYKYIIREQPPRLYMLTISNVQISDIGQYECRSGGKVDRGELTIRRQVSNVCDPLRRKCKLHNGRQPTQQTYQAHWICDGEDDCGNNFDESNCQGRFTRCNAMMFTCPVDRFRPNNPARKVPHGYVCDGENDCGYGQGNDEENCGPPSVNRIPYTMTRTTLREGQSYTISCSANINSNVPRIIWRLNWGCLPDFELEIHNSWTVTETYSNDCRTVNSTLTIPRVSSRFQGIYNCEALINKGRAFSQDIVLTVTN